MKNKIIGFYPENILINKNKFDQALNSVNKLSVIEITRLWQAGKTLKVSFQGGQNHLNNFIAQTANRWAEHGNITFDFGYNWGTNSFRMWTPEDRSHIRIGFSDAGYWSMVGNESVDFENITQPGAISLNLEAYDQDFPSDWENVILHEFGHALGFHHEFQSGINCDFDYPALYEFFEKNYGWGKSKVDANLSRLSDESGRDYQYSDFDVNSVMNYVFPAIVLSNKENSPCYNPTWPNVLSSKDKLMMSRAYPFEIVSFQKMIIERCEVINSILEDKNLDNGIVEHYKKHLKYYSRKREVAF